MPEVQPNHGYDRVQAAVLRGRRARERPSLGAVVGAGFAYSSSTGGDLPCRRGLRRTKRRTPRSEDGMPRWDRDGSHRGCPQCTDVAEIGSFESRCWAGRVPRPPSLRGVQTMGAAGIERVRRQFTRSLVRGHKRRWILKVPAARMAARLPAAIQATEPTRRLQSPRQHRWLPWTGRYRGSGRRWPSRRVRSLRGRRTSVRC